MTSRSGYQLLQIFERLEKKGAQTLGPSRTPVPRDLPVAWIAFAKLIALASLHTQKGRRRDQASYCSSFFGVGVTSWSHSLLSIHVGFGKTRGFQSPRMSFR